MQGPNSSSQLSPRYARAKHDYFKKEIDPIFRHRMFGANSPGAHEESIMENEYASSLTERRLESIRHQSIMQRHCTQEESEDPEGGCQKRAEERA